MKITKKQLKEMIHKVVREQLNEAYDRGDFAWQKSMQSDEVIQMLQQAPMPAIAKKRMLQVVDVLKGSEQFMNALGSPANKKKIEHAIAQGQYEQLLNALEQMVVRRRAN